jgi:hypothetical protein
MVYRFHIGLLSLIFASCVIHATSVASNPVLQIELEQFIKDCDAVKFKAQYATLEANFQTAQEKATSLASLESVAQETKKKKLVDLTNALSRGAIKAYRPFAKLLIQGIYATSFVSFGISHILFGSSHVGDFAIAILCLPIGFSLAYYTKNNYRQAFHADAYIKEDIARLDEIIKFLDTAKGTDHVA